MKIEIKLSNDQIMAVCKLLDFLEYMEPCVRANDKLYRSIAFEVYDRFQPLRKNVIKSTTLFSSKKRKVKLKYFEAVGLLNIIRELIASIPDEYSRTILNKLTAELDQKLR